MAEQYQCGALIVTCADPISLDKCPVFGEDFQNFGGFCPVHRNGPAPVLAPPDVAPSDVPVLSPFDTMANFNTAYEFSGKLAEIMSVLMDLTGGMIGSVAQPGHYASQTPVIPNARVPTNPPYSPASNLPAVQRVQPNSLGLSVQHAGYPVQQMGWVSVGGNGTTMISGTMTSMSVYYSN